MDAQRWIRAVILVGLLYALVGIAFAVPATHVRVWRLAAWLVSAAAFAAHIGYERYRVRNAPPRAAWHVALAVALGALGLAAGANIHSAWIDSASHQRRLLLAALVIWPIMTGLPAFVVALVASALLVRLPWNARIG